MTPSLRANRISTALQVGNQRSRHSPGSLGRAAQAETPEVLTMKTSNRISSGLSCFALFACSTAAEPPAGQTGASSSGGSAGMLAVAGGATAAAGASSSGASGAGSPGSMAGSASGGESAAGGSTTGGASAAGGASTAGAAGKGSVAGAGGGSAGGGSTVDTTLTGTFDGALLQYPCGGGNPNYDCTQPAPCSNASAAQPAAQVIKPSGGAASSWTMGGTPGTTYDVKVHIQGVVEPSWYHGGTRSAGNTTSIDVASTVAGAKPYAKDLFQIGGTNLSYADNGNGFDYNSYELDVTPMGGGAPSVYFLNSVMSSENPHTSSKTGHLSFEIDEMPTLKIAAGATISLTVRDSNCVQIQNCGTSNNNMCGNGSRSVAFTGSMPPPPASWTGKVTSGTGGNLNGQFVHFDVISVTVAQ